MATLAVTVSECYMPDIIKIDPYSFELYRFEVGAFSENTVYLYKMLRFRRRKC